MSPYTYPHTIENGAGERLTFMRRVQGPAGDRLEVENVVKPGSGPPIREPLPGGGAQDSAGTSRLSAARRAAAVRRGRRDGRLRTGRGAQVLERRARGPPVHGLRRTGRQPGVLPD